MIQIFHWHKSFAYEFRNYFIWTINRKIFHFFNANFVKCSVKNERNYWRLEIINKFDFMSNEMLGEKYLFRRYGKIYRLLHLCVCKNIICIEIAQLIVFDFHSMYVISISLNVIWFVWNFNIFKALARSNTKKVTENTSMNNLLTIIL